MRGPDRDARRGSAGGYDPTNPDNVTDRCVFCFVCKGTRAGNVTKFWVPWYMRMYMYM
jgi:hypothetical protein